MSPLSRITFFTLTSLKKSVLLRGIWQNDPFFLLYYVFMDVESEPEIRFFAVEPNFWDIGENAKNRENL